MNLRKPFLREKSGLADFLGKLSLQAANIFFDNA
jgi:hypothetical protein